MGILTELFARPRPLHPDQRRGIAILHLMSRAELLDLGIKPADFPRVARDMAKKTRILRS